MKFLDKLRDSQLPKKVYRVRLVSECFFIKLASNALCPFLPAYQYRCL